MSLGRVDGVGLANSVPSRLQRSLRSATWALPLVGPEADMSCEEGMVLACQGVLWAAW